jgi:integrase/recombinase XerD
MTYNNSTGICTLASVPRLDNFIERFTKERQYLKGVTPPTLAWYKYSLHAFGPVLQREYDTVQDLKAAVVQRIQELRGQGRGNKAVSINTYLRCFKAFLKWAYEENLLTEPLKLGWLKEEQNVLATLSESQARTLIAWKPAKINGVRLHLIVCLLLDTGLRVSEALSLTIDDIDFENLVLKIQGKGMKQRLVPFSEELRRLLWRYTRDKDSLIFRTRNLTRLSPRDVLRDMKMLGKALSIEGIRMSPHTLRHTFAVSYLRAGGNLFYLSRILGHTSIETTQRYLKSLGIADLQAVHSKLSLLSRRA